MPNTTRDRVKLLIEVPANLTDAMIDAFIADANLIVTEELSNKGLSPARLELIERWLTAHYVTQLTERGGLTSSEVDSAAETYNKVDGGSISSTRFGKQAIAFDTSGTLKELDMAGEIKAYKAQFRVL